uniref:Uncharacterized protein n=1 Tax=Rhizophora mucronata TaxID=61149 RepID=A0A2P2IQS4_RHIMU
MKAGRAYESPPTWEELADPSHGTPLPYYQSRAVACSASVNISDGTEVLATSNFLLSATHVNWGHSPTDFTPKLHEMKTTPETSYEDLLYDILKEGDTPEMQKSTSIPTETIKASSPNHKRVSPPQAQLQSVSSQTFRSGRKFVLPAVPSFPPLTPYSNSKDGIVFVHSLDEPG